ncbi:MAG TPA: glycine cleavage system aminomethyltransferase GcvT [Beijerinckiaceae bacterium]|nr:glycine cleavage system aminomethyltransferase GcvT [Beijerinckiaceae bacterium]
MSALPANSANATLLATPLHALHQALGARMAPFAGYDMPINYSAGVIAEHLHTRAHASLFDVSHMGQAILAGANAALALERLVPCDLRDLEEGRSRYTFLLNDEGAILDDLIVTRLSTTREDGQRFFLVVNGANKAGDWAHLRANLPDLRLDVLADRALLALQGPSAAALLVPRFPQLAAISFMGMIVCDGPGDPYFIARSGYTGEDGFEISSPATEALAFAQWLLSLEGVLPAGLGARDTLRLEVGLCLHGHDIDATTTPIEAGLGWAIPRRRRIGGGFPGADRIRQELERGPARRRVGLALNGRRPAREGAEITTLSGSPLGRVTSGGFSPTLERPIAMGYVAAEHAAPGEALIVRVRGTELPATVTPLPFVPHRYHLRESAGRSPLLA